MGEDNTLQSHALSILLPVLMFYRLDAYAIIIVASFI